MAELNDVTAGAESGANGATGEGNEQGQETKAEKTYTEKEFQSEIDRRVNQAMENARGKWEKEYAKRLEEEKKKAAERAAMSEAERKKAEFEDRERAITERENAYRREMAVFATTRRLAEKGLPVELAEALTGADTDETDKNIEAFLSKYNAAVERTVKEKLGASSKAPKTGGASQPTSGVEAAFYSLNPRLKR